MIMTTIETIGNFLKTALGKLFTYTTPKTVVRHIETNCLIQNPPFKTK
jgi:hypothetical protein